MTLNSDSSTNKLFCFFYEKFSFRFCFAVFYFQKSVVIMSAKKVVAAAAFLLLLELIVSTSADVDPDAAPAQRRFASDEYNGPVQFIAEPKSGSPPKVVINGPRSKTAKKGFSTLDDSISKGSSDEKSKVILKPGSKPSILRIVKISRNKGGSARVNANEKRCFLSQEREKNGCGPGEECLSKDGKPVTCSLPPPESLCENCTESHDEKEYAGKCPPACKRGHGCPEFKDGYCGDPYTYPDGTPSPPPGPPPIIIGGTLQKGADCSAYPADILLGGMKAKEVCNWPKSRLQCSPKVSGQPNNKSTPGTCQCMLDLGGSEAGVVKEGGTEVCYLPANHGELSDCDRTVCPPLGCFEVGVKLNGKIIRRAPEPAEKFCPPSSTCRTSEKFIGRRCICNAGAVLDRETHSCNGKTRRGEIGNAFPILCLIGLFIIII